MSEPLAYFISFTCYGTWLHGDPRGSADRSNHREPGTPYLAPDPRRQRCEERALHEGPYRLDSERRRVVLAAIQEVCRYRGWYLHAAHVRTLHLHVVVSGSARPEKMMTDFKAYASRRLNEAGFDHPDRPRWTRHGSTRYIWRDDHLQVVIRYVLEKQGEPMEVYRAAEYDAPCYKADRSEAQ